MDICSNAFTIFRLIDEIQNKSLWQFSSINSGDSYSASIDLTA